MFELTLGEMNTVLEKLNELKSVFVEESNLVNSVYAYDCRNACTGGCDGRCKGTCAYEDWYTPDVW